MVSSARHFFHKDNSSACFSHHLWLVSGGTCFCCQQLDDGVMTDITVPEELSDDNSEKSFQHTQGSEEILYKSPGTKMSQDDGDVGSVFNIYLSVERALHLPTVRHSSR